MPASPKYSSKCHTCIKILFQSGIYGGHWVAATFLLKVQPHNIFTSETSDTCSSLQILHIQTFYRNQHFVVDIQG